MCHFAKQSQLWQPVISGFLPILCSRPGKSWSLFICKKYDIKMSPFSSLSTFRKQAGGPLDTLADKIAAAKEVTKEQVLLCWASQTSGDPVVTWACFREFLFKTEIGSTQWYQGSWKDDSVYQNTWYQAVCIDGSWVGWDYSMWKGAGLSWVVVSILRMWKQSSSVLRLTWSPPICTPSWTNAKSSDRS